MRSLGPVAAWILIASTTSCALPQPRSNAITAPSPLHVAARAGDLAAARTVLERGCDLRHTTERGTALHEAVRGDHDSVARALLEAGADVDARYGEAEETTLHLAARLGNLRAARVLLDHGAHVDARTIRGWTPLHLLAGSGDNAVAMATVLLQRGADVDARGRDAWTPLFAAVLAQRADVVALLLRHDALVDAREAMLGGASPLELAVSLGDVPIAELLISAGADIDARNRDGGTALHVAAFSEQRETVALLLGEGADPNARDARGATPLHMAAGCDCDEDEIGKTAVAKLLIQYGASVEVRDRDGLTPLDVAVASEDDVLAELLRSTPPSGGYAECFRT